MFKKIFISVILFYFLTLFQASFMAFFEFKGLALNLILITVIIINLFEEPSRRFGLYSALIGGFFLDIWSSHIFGLETLILFLIALFVKFFIKNNFYVPSFFKK